MRPITAPLSISLALLSGCWPVVAHTIVQSAIEATIPEPDPACDPGLAIDPLVAIPLLAVMPTGAGPSCSDGACALWRFGFALGAIPALALGTPKPCEAPPPAPTPNPLAAHPTGTSTMPARCEAPWARIRAEQDPHRRYDLIRHLPRECLP